MTATAQNMGALARANVVKAAHAEFRRSLRKDSYSAGLQILAEALGEPVTGPIASLKVCEALLQVRRVGPEAMRAILRTAGVYSELRPLGELTSRQREALALECQRRAVQS